MKNFLPKLLGGTIVRTLEPNEREIQSGGYEPSVRFTYGLRQMFSDPYFRRTIGGDSDSEYIYRSNRIDRKLQDSIVFYYYSTKASQDDREGTVLFFPIILSRQGNREIGYISPYRGA